MTDEATIDHDGLALPIGGVQMMIGHIVFDTYDLGRFGVWSYSQVWSPASDGDETAIESIIVLVKDKIYIPGRVRVTFASAQSIVPVSAAVLRAADGAVIGTPPTARALREIKTAALARVHAHEAALKSLNRPRRLRDD